MHIVLWSMTTTKISISTVLWWLRGVWGAAAAQKGGYAYLSVNENTISSRNGFISIFLGLKIRLSITVRRGDRESGHQKAKGTIQNHIFFINPPLD